jgi:uroporphyrinogen-III synthase
MSDLHSPGFDGLRVAIFEARMAGPLADLVTRHGGVPVPAPALREIPLKDNPDVLAFAERLEAEEFDLVVFETGAGVRYLAESLQARLPRERWAELLGRTTVVARGPKPSAALRELGVSADLHVPEPNTWRETLTLLDEQRPVAGLRVAVQEYGKPVPELTEGLERRGAVVTRVPVYRWELPEDTGPLCRAISELAARSIGVALFTAAQQVEHVLEVARSEGVEPSLRAALADHVVVGSIGPTTSAALRAHDLPVDVEPAHPKSGHLVAAVAAAWRSTGKAGSGTLRPVKPEE